MTDASDNEKALKVIETQFQALQNASGHWRFFIALSDYVRTITETPALAQQIRILQEERERALRVFAMLDTRAMREALKTAEHVAAIVQQAHVTMEPVLRTVAELQKVISGSVLAASRVRLFDEHLFDVARALKEIGRVDLVRGYEVQNTPPKNIYGDFVFIPSLDERDREEKRVERARETELWGAWEYMPLAAGLVSDPDGFEARLKKEAETDPVKRWELFNLYGVLGELNRVRDKDNVSDGDVIFFRVDEFRNRADRIHAFLVRRVLGAAAPTPVRLSPVFNPDTAILTVAGRPVKTLKFSKQYHLLRIMFEKPARIADEWFYSEIAERYDDSGVIDEDKVFNNAAYQVAQKVAKDAGIRDFFIITKQSVKIDPKHLPTT